MHAFLDKKFINLVSGQLERFKWQRPTLANCRCPLCGDSQKNKNKCRGYFYERDGRYYYKCHNCGAACTVSGFLEQVSPALYSEFRLEWIKEKGGGFKFPEHPKDTKGITNTGVAQKLAKVNVHRNKLKHVLAISELESKHAARAYLESRLIPESKFSEIYYTTDFAKVAKDINPQIVLKSEERIVIPFYDDNENVIGIQGRAMDSNSLRYITVKAEEHERLFYNLHKIHVNKRIYVTEGPFDSMFLPNAVAMVGASKSINLPDKLQMRDVVFCLDNEPRSIEIVSMMRNLVAKEHKVFIPDNRLEEKDINEMILSGKKIENIVDYINDNTYGGILAQAALSQWEKTTERWRV